MQSIAVNLEPSQFLSGWRAQTGSLFLPTLSESRVGDEVAVRVGIYGQTIRATLFGKVALVRRVGRPSLPPGVELSLDKASLPAATFLAMAASGESVSFRERAPRFAVERRFLLSRLKFPPFETRTINLSEGGCSLAWQGELPQAGEILAMRIGDGLFAPTARAVVCWSTADAQERAVGVRIVPEGRGARAWRNLVAEVARSGARAA
jgi:PilZ domain-containing protein